MRVVSLSRATISSVIWRTLSAVLGSRAAVCSSSRSRRGFFRVAMSRVRAWRWPPESRPTLLVMRSSSPRPRAASCLRNFSRSWAVMPGRRVRRWPRRLARARFSSMPMVAAVPIMGSWKTRPRYLARLCSGRRVMSTPSRIILPWSAGKTPAIRFRVVDLPAPLPPMMVTKSPSSRVRSRPSMARFSLTVPALNVL